MLFAHLLKGVCSFGRTKHDKIRSATAEKPTHTSGGFSQLTVCLTSIKRVEIIQFETHVGLISVTKLGKLKKK